MAMRSVPLGENRSNDSGHLLEQVRLGDRLARERLIGDYRERALAMASKICARPLDRNNDDECSIALIALNEAIDSYLPEKGAAFSTHVYRVIRARLIDHFRREAKNQWLYLEGAGDGNSYRAYEQVTSLEAFRHQREAEEREMAMGLFVDTLADFKITIDDLVQSSPKHRDTRSKLYRAAQCLVHDEDLRRRFFTTRQLPLKELTAVSGLSRKVLETGRKYIVALAIVLADKEFHFVRSFLSVDEEKEGGCRDGNG
ncbi:hypothetical protein GTO91_16360 [Heliobacterium undosum]|uniref:RNA polymerase sigma factor SigI n=1 Tax=Heliomicrobium undosum TaxID=121734 RepID=A0A845LED6_9FIRM|nr:sigma factor [Heliomicrobium undosum]MZP31281.1 hypothetical protein [Heliomicrobium undosum]